MWRCIVSSLLMGSGPVFQEIAIRNGFPPGGIIFFSNFFAFVFFLVSSIQKKSLPKASAYTRTFFLSVLLSALGSALSVYNIRSYGADSTALFGRLYIPCTIILSWIYSRSPTQADYWSSFFVIVSIGLFVVCIPDTTTHFGPMILLAPLCFSLSHTLLSKIANCPHAALLFFSSLLSSLFFCHELPTGLRQLSHSSFLSLCTFACGCVLPSSIGILLYLQSLQKLPLSSAASLRGLTPVFTWITRISCGFPFLWKESYAYLFLLLPPILQRKKLLFPEKP